MTPLASAEAGTRNLPSGNLITYIADHLDPVSAVEEQHYVERRSGVAPEHVDERRPLPRGDRGERVREELVAADVALLPVELARQMRPALLEQRPELRAVGLPPLARRAVDVVERVPDLVHHHVGRRRGPVADHDRPVAVSSR